jgi:single-stranded-DNA-specific exonuclease
MIQLAPRIYDPVVVQALQTQGCSSLLAHLYAARGITHIDQVHPKLSQLLSPDTFKHAKTMAVCLADAIMQQDSLCIVADYDCDGATACAVALLGLRLLGARRVDFLVPNRFKNGYGLTPEVVEQVAIHPRLGKPDWIITVDNGISSVEGVDAANAIGIKVLITDHHLSATKLDDGSLPKAVAILNPNQPDCSFMSKDIAGVGVMFYALLLARTELRSRGVFTVENQPRLDTLLDLVAIGTIADVVKLDENNRILVAAGLERIRKNAMNGTLRLGIAALFQIAAKDACRATTSDIGFAIGPRINAAGRLDDMSIGILCLVSEDPIQAIQLAEQLQAMNLARRELETEMQASAQLQAETALSQLRDKAVDSGLVLYDTSWHQGVVGLVASRVKETYWRPTIAFAPADETGVLLRGSGRSIPGFHLRDALDRVAKQCPGLIHKFGGHSMAAGLTIAAQDCLIFQAEFSRVCTDLLSPETLARILLTDTAPTALDMTVPQITALEAGVWGQGFEPPIFESKALILEQRILNQAHLKLKLEIKGLVIDAIWFGQSETLPQHVRIAYRLGINEFRGNKTVQALIEYAIGLN